MKKHRKKGEFLDQLKTIPIVQVACEKVGISRNTVYRWKKEDEEFNQAMALSLAEGEELVNDMSESQLLTMVKEKNWSAISFWLRHHHPAYKNRLEVTTTLPQDKLTPEQEETVREALRLSATNIDISNIESDEPEQTDRHPVDGEDDQGPENPDSDH